MSGMLRSPGGRRLGAHCKSHRGTLDCHPEERSDEGSCSAEFEPQGRRSLAPLGMTGPLECRWHHHGDTETTETATENSKSLLFFSAVSLRALRVSVVNRIHTGSDLKDDGAQLGMRAPL